MREDDLHFTDLTAAQQRVIVATYAGRSDNETISTIRVLVKRGWLEPRTLILTPRGRQAYEFWMAWGTSAKAQAAVKRGRSKPRYIDKLKWAQRAALRTMGRRI